MIPVHLRLSGFLSYQDNVDLDFTSFELACISGSNGAGKSSLLDAITWALFGQARRRDDALINSHADAAEVAFDFSYEGNLYRVQRSKPRDKSTLLEFFICTADGVWKPLTEKSLRETEGRIQSTLRMDYETFTNASFLLQNRADQFAQQRPGDRKRVLSAILGLEVWEQYRTDATDRRKRMEADVKSIDDQITDIDSELSQEAARKARLHDNEVRMEQLVALRQAGERELANQQRLAAMLEEQRRGVEMRERAVLEARLRHSKLKNDLEELSHERESYQQVLAGADEAQAAYRRWQEQRAELERWDTVAANFREIEARRAAPLTAITAEASRLDQERRTLAAQELRVQQEEARLPEIQAERNRLAEEMRVLEEQLAGRARLEADLHETQVQAADAQAENRSLREAMKSLKERIVRLGDVEGAVCPLCGQPLSPEDRAHHIAELEQQGKEMGDRFRANQDLVAHSDAQVKALQAQISGLSRLQQDLTARTVQFDRKENEIKHISEAVGAWAQGDAARLAEVRRMLAEEDFAHEARTQLAAIDAESRALGYDATAHDAVKRAELAGRSSEAGVRAVEAARAALAPLERQIAGVESQLAQETNSLAGLETDYSQARQRYEREAAHLPDLNAAEQEVYNIQAEENRLRMEVGMLRQTVAILDVQRDKRARLLARREGLSAQVARLKTLERAFSKDGVPALLIEQALPEIETQANEILDRLSNGQMAVRFATQRNYKDKHREDRRETLDIIISDPAGEREYELFSGGEAFRVNFAIRLALSRVLAQRAGARLQTLVIDEGFGSQDADGRQRLIEAINLVRQDFAKVLVITHLEELKEAFPARIEVEKTPRGSRVTVVS